jgi:hypothetical protein
MVPLSVGPTTRNQQNGLRHLRRVLLTLNGFPHGLTFISSLGLADSTMKSHLRGGRAARYIYPTVL